MENIVLKASDGYALSLAVFESEHPRGYIQIIHGMEEHKERYEAFAEQQIDLKHLCKAEIHCLPLLCVLVSYRVYVMRAAAQWPQPGNARCTARTAGSASGRSDRVCRA